MVREDRHLEQGQHLKPVSMEVRQTPCCRKITQPTRLPASLPRLEEQLVHVELTLREAALQRRIIQGIDIEGAVVCAYDIGHCRTIPLEASYRREE